MYTEKEIIKSYFVDVKNDFCTETKSFKKDVSIQGDILSIKECHYIFDLTKGKIIDFSGFDRLFGYRDDEVTYDLIIDNYHPKDVDTILEISKASIAYCIERPFECENGLLQVYYRFSKKDGSYVKILSQSSVYKVNRNGELTQVLVKMTDVDFMDNIDYVKWTFETDNINTTLFNKSIYIKNNDLFTAREIDVIKEINRGLCNISIADELNISKSTVATHRKNIFKKSNCHTARDLMIFCKRNGFL